MKNYNAVTDAAYSIYNQNHLEEHKVLHELDSDAWAGFKQWQEKGRKVKKGAKGCKIFMVCEKKQENAKGEEEKKQVMKALYVFNYQHTEEI
ncbi:ArdC family protein [Microbulbifer sp. DLAB2-AA]|uniref:ArdC family protein n=1 Tax=Microbulbifer sp. DLAB2-AA TaxID=3243394 RepID=UPI00403A7C11